MYEKQGLAVTIDEASRTTKSTQALSGGSAEVAGGMYEQTLATAAREQTIYVIRDVVCRHGLLQKAVSMIADVL